MSAFAIAPVALLALVSTAGGTLTEPSQDGRIMMMVRAGVPFDIRLPTQFGTGFSWQPSPVAGLTIGEETVRAQSTLPGGGEDQIFQITPDRKGRFELEFRYRQPWKGGRDSRRVRKFVIVAAGKV